MKRTVVTALLALSNWHLTAAQRTDEASEAAITDPNAECVPYSIPAVLALQQAGSFPPIWEIANMSLANAQDVALYNQLLPSIPNIAPKGTPQGNFTGVNYNGVADADCWWTWKQCTTPNIPELQDDITRTSEPNTWGFTLDDGPNCSHNAYFDYLQSINMKATLFYIGSNVFDWSLEAQRGLDDGHEICAHTWSHRYMTALTNEEVFAELYYSKKAIKDVIGVTVACWRPPYGDVDDRVRYIAQALGMATVIWNENTFDYEIATLSKATVDGNYDAILGRQSAGVYDTAGAIVLTHELNNFTMQENEQFLPQIMAQFVQVLPIAVANNNTEPYAEPGYTYPNYEQWVAGTRSIALAPASAASVDATLLLSFSFDTSGSVFNTISYASGATAGATSAATTTTVAVVTVTSAAPSPTATLLEATIAPTTLSYSISATASPTKTASGSPSGGRVRNVVLLAAVAVLTGYLA